MSQQAVTPLREEILSQHGPVSYGRLEDVGVVRVANPPVNALSLAVRAGLLAAVQAAVADADTVGLVLLGDGNTFPAGADIREFDQPLAPPDLNDVNAALEASPKPVVAAIHGSALGGGLELGLAGGFLGIVARCGRHPASAPADRSERRAENDHGRHAGAGVDGGETGFVG